MAWWRKRHRCWLKEIWLRWLQRVMKSEKHAVTVMNLHCNYVFKTFAGKHGVLLKVFQKKVWKILKRAFDKCKKAWYIKRSCKKTWCSSIKSLAEWGKSKKMKKFQKSTWHCENVWYSKWSCKTKHGDHSKRKTNSAAWRGCVSDGIRWTDNIYKTERV